MLFQFSFFLFLLLPSLLLFQCCEKFRARDLRQSQLHSLLELLHWLLTRLLLFFGKSFILFLVLHNFTQVELVILPHVLRRLLYQLLVLGDFIAPWVFQYFIQLFWLFHFLKSFLVFDKLLFPELLSLRNTVSYTLPVNFSLLALFLLHIFFSLNFWSLSFYTSS